MAKEEAESKEQAVAGLSAPPPVPPQPQAIRPSKTYRAASALKSGVVYGGAALINGVNAITPHFAGAVDIMVVEQPDGSYKSSPFYVRFGKYTHLRTRDRRVQIFVNGEPAPFHMHLGEYGQAYFISDPTEDIREDDDEGDSGLLAGLMSPTSGYSSGDDTDRPPFATEQVLQSLQEEVSRLQSAQQLTGDTAGGDTDSSSPQPPYGVAGAGARGARRSRKAASAPLPVPPQALGAGHLASLPPGESYGSSALGISPPPPAHMYGVSPHSAIDVSPPSAIGLSPAKTVSGLEGLLEDSEHMGVSGSLTSTAHHLGTGVSPHSVTDVTTNGTSPGGHSPHHVTLRVLGFQEQGTGGVTGATQGSTTALQLGHSNAITGPARSIAALSNGEGGVSAQEPGSGIVGLASGLSEGTQAHHQHTSTGASTASLLSQSLKDSSVPPHTLAHTAPQRPPLQASDSHASASVFEGQSQSAVTRVTSSAVDADVSSSLGSSPVRSPTPLDLISPTHTAAQGTQGLAQAAAGVGVVQSVQGAGAVPPPPPPPPPPTLLLPPLTPQPAVAGSQSDSAAVPHTHPHPQAHTQHHHHHTHPHPHPHSHPSRHAMGGLHHTGVLQGLELSLCGQHLRPGMPYSEAVQMFEACRIGPADWAEKGQDLIQSPHLMVRLQGEIYAWSVAAPLVLGWAAFGAWWPHLLPADSVGAAVGAGRWAPPSGLSPMNSGVVSEPTAAPIGDDKKGWRLWPFSSSRSKDSRAPSRTPPPHPSPSPSLHNAEVAHTHSTTAGAQQQQGLPHATSSGLVSAPSGALSQAQSRRDMSVSMSEPARHLGRTASSVNRKTLSPSRKQLNALRLKAGQNIIKYVAGGTELVAYVYFYHWATKIVISDIDGTITRSDVLGHLLPAMGWDWSHAGISRLFTDIAKNNYQLMYLSSRSISQAGITREYLNTLVQGEHRMPEGPVIISPHGLIPSLYREMILRRPHEFKIATLSDIRALFPPEWNPFYSGFGNRDTDEISYRAVGVPLGRIFIINPKGELRKAALTMQSSTLSSLAAVNQLLDDIFPPCGRTQPYTAVQPSELPAADTTAAQALTGAVSAQRPQTPSEAAADAAGTAEAHTQSAAEHGAAVGGLAAAASSAAAAPATGSAKAATGGASATSTTHTAAAAGVASTAAAGIAAPAAGMGRSGSNLRLAQQQLMSALQQVDSQYNDVNYWGNDPSYYMAGGDVDELERYVIAAHSAGSPGASGAGGEGEEGGAEGGEGGDTVSALRNVSVADSDVLTDLMNDGRSRDFIVNYNPFAY